MTDTILLSLILVFVVATFFLGFSYLAKEKMQRKEVDPTIDIILADLKKTIENVTKLKRASDNHSKLILRVFQILKDSIENDLSQEEVLKIINSLNLPLVAKDKQEGAKVTPVSEKG